MYKRHSAPLALSKSLCVIEITRDRNDPPHFVACTISIAGRPAARSRSWPLTGVTLDVAQGRDIAAWVTATVLYALECSVGVQGVLALDS